MAWRLQFLGFLLIKLALLARICATAKGECSYTLEVKTSGLGLFHYDPGTKDHVRVRFGDESQREVMDDHLSDPFEGNKQQPFKRGKTAKFNISGTCVESEVCYLYFKVEGTDKWKADYATVYIRELNYTFYFEDRYMPEKCWHGKDHCKVREQLASQPSDDSMYKQPQKTKIKSHQSKGGKYGGA